MKRLISYIAVTLMLTICLCSCGRNDMQDLNDNGMPTVTSSPNLLPQPDTGTVNDSDGIIEKADEDIQSHRDEMKDDKAASSPAVTSSPAVSSSPTVSASPNVTANP